MEKYKGSADNRTARASFITYWVEYVRSHPDEEWSWQQNILINSVLASATQLDRKKYLQLKGEKCFLK